MQHSVEIRRAVQSDVPSITSCVCEAYLHYIELIGKQPGPMIVDYASQVAQHDVRVAVTQSAVEGLIVLKAANGLFWLENIAVRPRSKGLGLGRVLLKLAETNAREAGYSSIRLYTNELMTENCAWYERSGFIEDGREVVNGYRRVYYEKKLTKRE